MKIEVLKKANDLARKIKDLQHFLAHSPINKRMEIVIYHASGTITVEADLETREAVCESIEKILREQKEEFDKL